jgi:hypoxia-inducible factor 1-alpha inhibitor (HIF hydroxylase)
MATECCTRRARTATAYRRRALAPCARSEAVVAIPLPPQAEWTPPPAALREGGLWLLSDPHIKQLRAAASPKALLDVAYGTGDWFEKFAPSQLELPRVDCARLAGAPLPQAALRLVSGGMCCVLERARLWPAAEDAWCNEAYLRRELRGVDCYVLSSPVSSRRFSYWFDASGYSDRVQAGYLAKPLVTTMSMSIEQFLEASSPSRPREPAGCCLYLQQSILQTPPGAAAGLAPCKGLGDGIRRDVEQGIDMGALRGLIEAGGFGPWQRCQLFVGGASASGARSILHYDQYDNLFVQISGTKRFRIFDPLQTGNLYPYPIHHPLDTRAQVDLEQPDHEAFPRLRDAKGFRELTLRPGETLFLPAYWWHEVVTDSVGSRKAANGGGGEGGVSGGELTVSVNFWFAASNRILQPSLPLVPSMQIELSRQLEYLVSDCLRDQPRLVPDFLSATLGALEEIATAASSASSASYGGQQGDEEPWGAPGWPALHARRPSGGRGVASAVEWQGLFSHVCRKLALLIGPANMLPFLRDLCHPSRFTRLRVTP